MSYFLKRIVHILSYVLAVISIIAFNYLIQLEVVVVFLQFFSFLLTKESKYRRARIILSAAICVLMGVAAFVGIYIVKNLSLVLMCVLTFMQIVLDIREKAGRNLLQKLIGLVGYVGFACSLVIIVALTYNAFNPDAFAIYTQNGAADYPVDPEETYESLDGGVQVYRDVTYESSYPNNTYTVYVSPENKGTIFYIHGGGFCIGDKDDEDYIRYQMELIDGGYNVVTVDYTLAPQDPYPAAGIQVNEAFKFFIGEAQEKYGIDPDRVVVCGNSAGSQLAGHLANLQTNPEYAKEMGITPALEGTDLTLKGYISLSGLVDCPRFKVTGFPLIDLAFDTWGRSAFQDNDYPSSEEGKRASVLNYVTENFPPSYVSDANFASFYAQGKDLVVKLESLGVPVTANFPDRSKGLLGHDFELKAREEVNASENLDKTLEFLDGIFG